jgi:L-lactate dehydrogenase (cytochrome)
MKELLGNSPFAKVPHVPNILAHPGWLISFLFDGGVPKLQNVVIPGRGPTDMLDVATDLSESTVTWS